MYRYYWVIVIAALQYIIQYIKINESCIINLNPCGVEV